MFTVDYFRREEGSMFGSLEVWKFGGLEVWRFGSLGYKSPDRDEILVDNIKNMMLSAVGTKC